MFFTIKGKLVKKTFKNSFVLNNNFKINFQKSLEILFLNRQ